MSLIKCSRCGKEFSDKASSCPNCGLPVVDYNSRYRSSTKPTPHYNITTGFIIRIFAIIFFALLAYVGISQRNVPGGENNIYLGIVCLIIVFLLLLSPTMHKKKTAQITKVVTPSDSQSSQYWNEVLPNGLTIAEQQQIDYNIAQGKYPTGTPSYCGMRIVSSTIPSSPGYANLNDDEKAFLSAFHDKLIEAKYNPDLIKLTRLSNGTFNVDYIGLCYVGKILLHKSPDIYAVIKKGNVKATKVFNDLKQAEDFSQKDPLYEIQRRQIQSATYMQYSIGTTSVKEMHNPTLQQCIDTIPRWIRYLNYCKKN